MSLDEYGYTITTKDPNDDWGPTEFKYMDEGSATGTFSADNSQATIAYLCDFAYVNQFLDVVLGKTVVVGGQLLRSATTGTFDSVQGSLPEPHPTLSNFYATSAELDNRGVRPPTGTGPYWNKALITVVFRPPTYNVIGDGEVDNEYERFTTVIPEGNAEFQTTTGFFRFVTSQRVLETTPGFVVPASKFTYTWHNIPAALRGDGHPDLGTPPNFTTVMALMGQLNTETFDGWNPGTVLLTSWAAKLVLPQTSNDNSYVWQISYIFGIRDYGASPTPVVTGESIGWNYAYDPLNKRWDLLTTDGTVGGGTLYQYGNFSDLFEVTW